MKSLGVKRVKIYKQIIDSIVKIVSVMLMLLISGLVVLILYELFLRNFLNKSFRCTTELCGFMFMWMAFLGIIVLYDQDRLITLDMIYVRVHKNIQVIFWYINKLFSLGLGITMVIAYIGLYPYVSTSYFSTMTFLTKAWHFLPMAIAGAFIAVKTIYQLIEKSQILLSANQSARKGERAL